MSSNLLGRLEAVRIAIAALQLEETTLVDTIIAQVKHNHVGQKTYDFEGKKIVVETKETVTLDKPMLNTIYDEWMPINRTYSYTPRVKDLNAMLQNGTPEQRKVLSQVVTTKAAKPVVKIKEQ